MANTWRPLLGNPLVTGCLPEFTFWVKSTRLRVWRTQVQVWSVAVHSAPQCKRGVHWKLLWRLQEHTERPAKARGSPGTGDLVAGSVWPGAALTTCHSIKVSRGLGLYVPGPCFDLQMGARRRTCCTWISRVGVGTGLLRDDTLQGNYLHTGSRGGMPGRLSPPEKSSLQPCPASSTGAPVCSKRDTADGNAEQ